MVYGVGAVFILQSVTATTNYNYCIIDVDIVCVGGLQTSYNKVLFLNIHLFYTTAKYKTR